MHDARSVANELIKRGIEDGNPLTPLQVIKMTYYCKGWSLSFNDEPLFHQKVEAWQFGPVIGDVYRAIKQWRNNPIRQPIQGYDGSFGAKELSLIDEVYDAYKEFDGIQLSSMTHQDESPWHKSWHKNSNYLWRTFGITTNIPDGLLKEYFSELASQKTTGDESTSR